MADYVYRAPPWAIRRQPSAAILGIASSDGTGTAAISVGVSGTGAVTFAGVGTVPISVGASGTGVASVFPLSISSDSRWLTDATGQPFFINGTSGWLFFTEPSVATYTSILDSLQALGVNAVLVQLFSRTQSSVPNLRDGTAPFSTPNDFATINNTYLTKFRDFVRACAARGILVGVAPMYAGFAQSINDGWFSVMSTNGTTKTRTLGQAIGTVLANEPNLILVPGGDFTPSGGNQLYGELIGGIQDTAPLLTLVMGHWDQTTNSPNGIRSSQFIPPTSTLEGCYSWVGTTGNLRTVYTLAHDAWAAGTTRPVVGLEYEYRRNTLNTQLGTDFTARFQAISFWLAGGVGFGFGGDEWLWPVDSSGTIPPQAASGSWVTALTDSFFTHLKNVKAFATARAPQRLVPDQSNVLLTAGRGTYGTDSYVNGALASDRSFAVAYLPTGSTGGALTVNMGQLVGQVLARWFSPTTNSFTAINGGVPFNASGSQSFTAPDTGDWILALDATPGSDVIAATPSYRMNRFTHLRM